LARHDPYQFQFWSLGLVGARTVGNTKKKGADHGIDGIRYFTDEQSGGAWLTKRMLVQVKGGHVSVRDIRDLVGTLNREKAEMAVLVTLEPPTAPMKAEAASAGNYLSPWHKRPYPRVQILTVAELLADPSRPNPRCLQLPGSVLGPGDTLPQPPKHKARGSKQLNLDIGASDQ
jgi:hypothetical protein